MLLQNLCDGSLLWCSRMHSAQCLPCGVCSILVLCDQCYPDTFWQYTKSQIKLLENETSMWIWHDQQMSFLWCKDAFVTRCPSFSCTAFSLRIMELCGIMYFTSASLWFNTLLVISFIQWPIALSPYGSYGLLTFQQHILLVGIISTCIKVVFMSKMEEQLHTQLWSRKNNEPLLKSKCSFHNVV